jgi:hypothetical protein
MPPSKHNRKKKAKTVLTAKDKERLIESFYKKVDEYMRLPLTTLRDMEKSMMTSPGKPGYYQRRV